MSIISTTAIHPVYAEHGKEGGEAHAVAISVLTVFLII